MDHSEYNSPRTWLAAARTPPARLPRPVGGADGGPEFDRRAVVARLLVNGKIGIPSGPDTATVSGPGDRMPVPQ